MGNGKTADTRQEALATNASFYHGRPCKYGHGTVRLTCNNTCYTCQQMRSSAWYEKTKEERKPEQKKKSRQYYLDNKERIKEKTKAYKEENSEYYDEYMKRYREDNKEYLAEYRKRRYEENKAEILESNKRSRMKKPEFYAEIKRRHYDENKHQYVARASARRERERVATPAWADMDEISAFFELSDFATQESGEQYHVDHIIPLQGRKVCGLHVQDNLRVIPATENRAKSNKLIEDLL